MNFTSSIYQRTRSRRFQQHSHLHDKSLKSFIAVGETNKLTYNSGNATITKKRKAGQSMNLSRGGKRRRTQRKMNVDSTGSFNDSSDDEDDIIALGPVLRPNPVKIEVGTDEERTEEVRVSIEESDHSNGTKNPKISKREATKTSQEDDGFKSEDQSRKGCDLPKSTSAKPLHIEVDKSSIVKKAIKSKTNARMQIEESFTKKISALVKEQKYQPSTSSDEAQNDSALKHFSKTNKKDNIAEKPTVEKESELVSTRKSPDEKAKDFLQVLADVALGEEETPGRAAIIPQAKPSPARGYSLPLKFRFEDDIPKEQEKSDYEIMVAGLFSEMEHVSAYDDSMNTFDFTKINYRKAEATEMNSCREGKHDLVRYESIGDVCRICHHVVREIRDILPHFAKNLRGSLRKDFAEKEKFLVPKDLLMTTTLENLKDSCKKIDGTVWNIIPGLKERLYKHQQDGFEFLWRNLEGTTDLSQMKNFVQRKVGGCIISHAPGTGKTRMSIVFLQSYMKLFPDSRPVVIAPASMLLTWEEEFKKWEVEFPFHNLCNPEFSGKENKDLLKLFTTKSCQDKNIVRKVKMFTWRKEESVLGISYNSYEKLARKMKKNAAEDEESIQLKEMLLQLPKVVVLDEGHIPRNESSSILKTLSEIKTEKKIILSGTPFQNNFSELFNTLNLVRPRILEKEKASFPGKRLSGRKQKADMECLAYDTKVGEAIEKIKSIMEPFVHIHKGSILQSLPGLQESVILLKPEPLQKSLIEKVENSVKVHLDNEYKVALSSVHPSLAENWWTSDYETLVNKDILKEMRLDPKEGSKTKFIMALIRFSMEMNEKVLIFSQYINPLELIKDQLKENFDWHEEKEFLHIKGRTDQHKRQRIISIFNNPNSESKVLLAATKCCSEGISLVGASRVVLLDVVWNPSKERQAISRAFRIGQEKVVYTYHLVTSGTSELHKYHRQAEKERMSELVFASSPQENDEPRLRVPLTPEDAILQEIKKHVQFEIIPKPKRTNLVQTFASKSPA